MLKLPVDHATLTALIPHAGSMSLLDSVEQADAQSIVCTATSHTQPNHPMRVGSRLGAVAAIEYAAQAMALHSAWLKSQQNGQPSPASSGFLTSVRSIHCNEPWLDDLPNPLRIEAHCFAHDSNTAIYNFAVHHDDQVVVQGRLSALLDASHLAV